MLSGKQPKIINQRKNPRPVGAFLPVLGFGLLFAGLLLGAQGCATQADVVDIQFDLDREKLERESIKKRLSAIESLLRKGLPAGQQGGAPGDFVIKLDQVSEDLKTVQGRLEENSHFLSELVQRFDDESFRTKELTARLDALDLQIAAFEKAFASSGPGSSAAGPGGGPSSDNRVVLPGRPTQPDGATGLSPSEAYGLAYNDFLKGNYDLALLGFQNFLKQFDSTSLAPNARYWIGESYYGKKEYIKAIDSFDQVVRDYPQSDKVSGAVLKAGYAFAEIGDKAKARSYLRQVIEKYPLSNEAKLAKNKLAEIR